MKNSISVDDVKKSIIVHLSKFWPSHSMESFEWTIGPIKKSISDFFVLRLEPRVASECWIYCSIGAWKVDGEKTEREEFFILAPNANAAHIETLTMLANFHASEFGPVNVGKIIDIGRAWVDGSTCDHALVSLPYIQGPGFEFANIPESPIRIRFLWLLPITREEAAFAKKSGVEKLESIFEDKGIDAADFNRLSVV